MGVANRTPTTQQMPIATPMTMHVKAAPGAPAADAEHRSQRPLPVSCGWPCEPSRCCKPRYQVNGYAQSVLHTVAGPARARVRWGFV